jgi:hypothetical protein
MIVIDRGATFKSDRCLSPILRVAQRFVSPPRASEEPAAEISHGNRMIFLSVARRHMCAVVGGAIDAPITFPRRRIGLP